LAALEKCASGGMKIFENSWPTMSPFRKDFSLPQTTDHKDFTDRHRDRWEFWPLVEVNVVPNRSFQFVIRHPSHLYLPW
jgi:hypothetical protein